MSRRFARERLVWILPPVLLGVATVASRWPFPGSALWPSAVAVVLVLSLRRAIPGLAIGAFAGAIQLAGGDWLSGFVTLWTEHVLPSFASSWKTGAIVFTLLLGGLVALLERGGALAAVLSRLLPAGPGARRRTECGLVGFGFLCFFDGLANSLLLGRLGRAAADRAGVSRLKLAYLVDSTSSPVACVAVISTWIAFQLGLIEDAYRVAGQPLPGSSYAVFLGALPYQFHAWTTLALVAIAAWLPLDLGRIGSRPATSPELQESPAADPGAAPAAWRALLPLATLVLGVGVGLVVSGRRALGLEGWPGSSAELAAAVGASPAATVLVVAAAAAVVVALVAYPRHESGHDPEAVFLEGASQMLGPVMILLGAWALGSVLEDLGAAARLSAVLSDSFPSALLPAAVFLVGAGISFSTGTSWGTIGLLTPLALPVALGLAPAPDSPLVLATLGAVFGGAVFGDHASPLSDTTVVSAVASGVETADHVETQMPYALLAAGVALVGGFLPVGLGVSVWFCMPACLILLAAIAWVLARRARPARLDTAGRG